MNLFRNSLLLSFALTLAAGCNDIAENDRLIPVEKVEAQRAVLIEDFTGQNCVNCPRAHEVIELLEEQYGDAVIPVSIHAGGFGIPATNTRYTGLMQPEGNTYNDMWGIQEWPMGLVDRVGGAITHDKWAALVREELARPTDLILEASAVCPEGSDEIAIELTLKPSADIRGKLQLWITESGIVARQQDKELGRINDYVHNNVYRASVNGVGGEEISLKGMIHETMAFSQTLRKTDTETWVPANLTVVAFVYDDNGVIQATKTKVKTDNSKE